MIDREVLTGLRLSNAQRHTMVAFASLAIVGLVGLAFLSSRPSSAPSNAGLQAELDTVGTDDTEPAGPSAGEADRSSGVAVFSEPADPLTVSTARSTTVETPPPTRPTTAAPAPTPAPTDPPDTDPPPTEPTEPDPDPDPSITEPSVTVPDPTEPDPTKPSITYTIVPLPTVTFPPIPRPTLPEPDPGKPIDPGR